MKTSLAPPLLAAGLILVGSACRGGTVGAGPSPTPDGGACPRPFAECDGTPATVCETKLDDDATNCGACGTICPPGGAHQVATCTKSTCGVACEEGFVDCDHDAANGCEEPVATCGVTTLVATVAAAIGLAVDDAFVYYGSRGSPPDYADGAIYKVPKNGGPPVVLATGLNLPLNLTIDDARVYWSNGGHTDRTDGSIASVAKSGGAVTVVAGPYVRPGNPVISGDRVFFTVREQPTGRIVSALKDGTDASPTTVAAGLGNATDLELAGSTLVWATSGVATDGSDALVERANLDGSGRLTLAKGIANPSYQLGVASDAVFVGSFADGTIRRLPFDLTAPSIVASGLGAPHEIVADGSTVYATTAGRGWIIAVPITGGTPVHVAEGQVFTSYLASDAEFLYWTDGPLTGAGAIRKAKKVRP